MQIGGGGFTNNRQSRPLPVDPRMRRHTALWAGDGAALGDGLTTDGETIRLDTTAQIFIDGVTAVAGSGTGSSFSVTDGSKTVMLDASVTDPEVSVTDGTVTGKSVVIAGTDYRMGTSSNHDVKLVANDTAWATLAKTGEFYLDNGSGNVVELDAIATDPGVDITDGTVTGVLAVLNASSELALGTFTNHPLLLVTNNTTRVTVESTGEFTSESGSKQVQLDPISTNPNASVTDGTVTASLVVNAATNAGVGTVSNHPFFIATNNTTRITVAANGIITCAIGSNSCVIDLTGDPVVQLTNGTVTSTMKVAGSTAIFGTTTDHQVLFQRNNSTAFSIDSGGNVNFTGDVSIDGQLTADSMIAGTDTPTLVSGDIYASNDVEASNDAIVGNDADVTGQLTADSIIAGGDTPTLASGDIHASNDVTGGNDADFDGQLVADSIIAGSDTPTLVSGQIYASDDVEAAVDLIAGDDLIVEDLGRIGRLAVGDSTDASALSDGDMHVGDLLRTSTLVVGTSQSASGLSGGDARFKGEINVLGDINHDGANVGFGGVTPHAVSHASMGARTHFINMGLADSGMNTSWNT